MFSQRSIRPDWYTDGRLIGVSARARLLAIALEALADPTGCVRRDARGIRAAAGAWLATEADGVTSMAEIEDLLGELGEAGWIVEDSNQQPHVLYLKGFGDRQQSQYVYVGAAHDGTLKPHLVTPCVSVEARNVTQKKGGKPSFRGFAVHCSEPASSCPCHKMCCSTAVAGVETPGESPETVQRLSRDTLEPMATVSGGCSERESGSASGSGSESAGGNGGSSESDERQDQSHTRGNALSEPALSVAQQLAQGFEDWRSDRPLNAVQRRQLLALCSAYEPDSVRQAIRKTVVARSITPQALAAVLSAEGIPCATPRGDSRLDPAPKVGRDLDRVLPC